MHKPQTHVIAIQQIEGVISEFPETRILDSSDIGYYKGFDFSVGWEIAGLCGDSSYKLRLLGNHRLPFQPLRVAVWPPPPILEWPHLEEFGILCLRTSMDSHSITDLASVTIRLLDDASRLVIASLAGENRTEFEGEFQDYWVRWDKVCLEFRSICSPLPESREVVAWRSRIYTLIADNEALLESWLVNRFGSLPDSFKPEKAALIWLDGAIDPKKYPSTVGDLRNLISSNRNSKEVLDRYLTRVNLKRKTVIVGVNGESGVGYLGVALEQPRDINNGFRTYPPPNIVLQRLSGVSIVGARVKRIDRSWVHGRDKDPKSSILKEKTIIIFGIGSIGSGVAEILAKAGVGKLVLVDPENLEAANASRHSLGIDSIGLGKANSLASVLRKRYPHLQIESYQTRVEAFIEKYPDYLHASSLIISAIGDWAPEAFFTDYAERNKLEVPSMFVWLEPHAVAGHAVVVSSGAGCLMCLTSGTGRVLLPVSSWDGIETIQRVAACAGMFQPYGAAESAHVHAMASELALDVLLGEVTYPYRRTWINSRRTLMSHGGKWNPQWEETHGPIANGGFQCEPVFQVKMGCRMCREI